MRIDKLLTSMGLASRTESAKAAKQGLIKVNGNIILKSDIKVDPEIDVIEYMGKNVSYKKNIYIKYKYQIPTAKLQTQLAKHRIYEKIQLDEKL